MTKEDKRNSILGLIVLLIVVGGIFLYKKIQNRAPEDVKEELQDETQTDETKQNEDGGSLEDNTDTTDGGIKVETSSNDQNTKFDALLVSGSQAFLDKNYSLAIKIYNEALALDSSEAEVVYIRLYSIYNVQGDTKKAEEMLNKAIEAKPIFTDYWVTKLTFLDQKTNTSFSQLKTIYEDGLKKVDSKTKVNLVTTFAGIAESNKEYQETISAWQKAIELYPQSKAIYQAEIDRLKNMN